MDIYDNYPNYFRNQWQNEDHPSYMRELPMPPMPPMPHPKPIPWPEPHIPPMPLPTPIDCPEPENEYYTYPKNLVAALNLIEEAVMDERRDELFYDCMIKLAPCKEDKEIIEGIREDEKKHSVLFRGIYCQLTGEILPPAPETEFTPPKTYCQGIQEAIFGELSAVEKYRRILYALQDRAQINKMVEIITDEQKHATKWNYLYSKNECAEKCRKKADK